MRIEAAKKTDKSLLSSETWKRCFVGDDRDLNIEKVRDQLTKAALQVGDGFRGVTSLRRYDDDDTRHKRALKKLTDKKFRAFERKKKQKLRRKILFFLLDSKN